MLREQSSALVLSGAASLAGARQAAADSARSAAAAADSTRRAAEMARITGVVGEPIHYAFDRALVRADDRAVLDRKVEALRTNASIRVRIDGHCDIRGPAEYNMRLGMRRAESARDYLTAAGIASDRIEVMSYGESRPVDPGTTREAHARNRRAEFTIIAGGPR